MELQSLGSIFGQPFPKLAALLPAQEPKGTIADDFRIVTSADIHEDWSLGFLQSRGNSEAPVLGCIIEELPSKEIKILQQNSRSWENMFHKVDHSNVRIW